MGDSSATAPISTARSRLTRHIASIGDFNGDAIDDIMWQNTNGQLSNWLGQPNGGFIDNSSHAATINSAGWHVQDPFVHDPFA